MGCGIEIQAKKLADVTEDLTDQCIERATGRIIQTQTVCKRLAFLVQNKTISFTEI